LSVSWVGLWRGLIARSTFGLAHPHLRSELYVPAPDTALPRAGDHLIQWLIGDNGIRQAAGILRIRAAQFRGGRHA
jgi:hypothetical protein